MEREVERYLRQEGKISDPHFSECGKEREWGTSELVKDVKLFQTASSIGSLLHTCSFSYMSFG